MRHQFFYLSLSLYYNSIEADGVTAYLVEYAFDSITAVLKGKRPLHDPNKVGSAKVINMLELDHGYGLSSNKQGS